MRNLKKILALVLALVMSMSMLATANAFTDDESIDETFTEAVEVLSGLKVFQGRPDGSFDPKAGITRAEVAAIIYRIVSKDVEDKQVSIYADYDKFDDVNSASWYAGYVNFCANGLYIKGHDGKFAPNDPVTGYQALAMILRALGYDANGEFTGAGWEVRTATIAKSLGITDNIAAGTLGTAASREVVAEILFRAILADTVNYQPAFGYVSTEKNLGYENFGLECIEGVVVANEYADLYGASALAEGKTELETADKTYTLAYSTDVTDLGEARYAYITGSKVLSIADAGNDVYENAGAAVAKLSKATTLGLDDAESYINFGGDADAYTSDYRIEYVLKFADADAVEEFEKDFDVELGEALTYNEVFRVGKEISANDMGIIKGIFYTADKETDIVVGEVYVGTKSGDDKSDEISYRKFVAEYINDGTAYAPVSSADNGEWLKVIDNDGDGAADYIFRVDFVMTTIEDINTKKETYTFEDGSVVAMGDVVTEIEELAEGDVILYTLIDGVYYVSYPEVAVESIDKKGINYKAETFTCGDNVYSFSGIDFEAYNYYHDVSEASTETSYDLYLDHFGYIRLYTESALNRGFVLLTDGYFETDRRVDGYKAEIWNLETEDYEDVDVLDSSNKNYQASNFIENDVVDHDDEGTWDRLIEAGQRYFGYANEKDDPFTTNIAAYSADEDGYSLTFVQNASNRREYDTAEIALNDKSSVKDRTLTNVIANELRVQTTTETLYYYVLNPGTSKETITSWVGYNNAPEGVALGADAVAYAVTTEASNAKYDIAQIVVFETSPAVTKTVNFVYALDQKLAQEKYVNIYAIGAGEDGYELVERDGKITEQADGDKAPWNIDDLIEFYTINSKGDTILIDEDYNDYNIFAGLVITAEDVDHRDYVQVSYGNTSAHADFYADNTPTFAVTYSEAAAGHKDTIWVDGVKVTRIGNVRTTYDIVECNDFSAGGIERDDMGDHVIFMTDDKGNVEYVINVTESVYGKDDSAVAALNELWAAIWADQNIVELNNVEAALEAYKAFGEVTVENIEDAKVLLAEMMAAYTAPDKDAKPADVVELGKKANELNAAIIAMEPTADLADAKQALKDIIAENYPAIWTTWNEGIKAAAIAWIDAQTDIAKVTADNMHAVATKIYNAQNTAKGDLEDIFNDLTAEQKNDVATIYENALDAIDEASSDEAIAAVADKAAADIADAIRTPVAKAPLDEVNDKTFTNFADVANDTVVIEYAKDKDGKVIENSLVVSGTIPASKKFSVTDTKTRVIGFNPVETDSVKGIFDALTKSQSDKYPAETEYVSFYGIQIGKTIKHMIVGDSTKGTTLTVDGVEYTITYDLKW